MLRLCIGFCNCCECSGSDGIDQVDPNISLWATSKLPMSTYVPVQTFTRLSPAVVGKLMSIVPSDMSSGSCQR